MGTEQVIDRVNEINFDIYSPENIEDMGNYIDLHGERQRLEKVIERANKPYLIYGAKGIGKTSLVHSICKDKKYGLVEVNCSAGTNIARLEGRLQIDNDGSYFERGIIPIAFEASNHFKHVVLYIDEIGALNVDIQKWLNRPLDKRNSCSAGGKTYKLNPNCKLSIIATTNPIEYAGVNNLTEDLRSRFIGRVWDYPSADEMTKIIDWTDIPEGAVKEPLLTLAQDTYGLRIKGDTEYVLSTRDIIQFVEVYRDLLEDYDDDDPNIISNVLLETIHETIMIKYTDPHERELIKARVQETFGVTFK
jgi:MoxR-like ATPase